MSMIFVSGAGQSPLNLDAKFVGKKANISGQRHPFADSRWFSPKEPAFSQRKTSDCATAHHDLESSRRFALSRFRFRQRHEVLTQLKCVQYENPLFFARYVLRISYCVKASKTTTVPFHNMREKSWCQMGFALDAVVLVPGWLHGRVPSCWA